MLRDDHSPGLPRWGPTLTRGLQDLFRATAWMDERVTKYLLIHLQHTCNYLDLSMAHLQLSCYAFESQHCPPKQELFKGASVVFLRKMVLRVPHEHLSVPVGDSTTTMRTRIYVTMHLGIHVSKYTFADVSIYISIVVKTCF